MDPSRFDGLVRSLAQRSTRRGILGISIGGAAGLLTAATPGSAKHHHHGGDRPCKNNGKTCRKGRHCCSGKCAPPPTDRASNGRHGSICCGAGQVQYDGRCCTPACQGICGSRTICGKSVECGACLPNGSPCTTDGQCSSGICNAIYGICYQCLPANSTDVGYCTRDAECCPGLKCPAPFPAGSGACVSS